MEHEDRGRSIRELEAELARMEAKLQASYMEMGKSLLEMADKEYKAVNHLVDEIVETKKKLSKARNEIECPECTEHNTSDSKYCKRCGKKLALPEGGSQWNPGK